PDDRGRRGADRAARRHARRLREPGGRGGLLPGAVHDYRHRARAHRARPHRLRDQPLPADRRHPVWPPHERRPRPHPPLPPPLRAYVRGVRDYVRAMQDRDPAAFEEVVPMLIKYTTVKDRTLFEKAIPSGLKPDPLPNVQSIADDQEWYLAHGYQQQRIDVAR